jgi:hypothetical protein
VPLIQHALTLGQPLIQVFVGVSAPRQQALVASGQPVPPAQRLAFLIDTGASGTCVDPAAIVSLNLSPTGTALIQTPSTGSTPHSCNTYDVSLTVPSPSGLPLLLPALPIIESQLKLQGIDGLLGRDVLAKCTLFYNGPLAGYTLAY